MNKSVQIKASKPFIPRITVVSDECVVLYQYTYITNIIWRKSKNKSCTVRTIQNRRREVNVYEDGEDRLLFLAHQFVSHGLLFSSLPQLASREYPLSVLLLSTPVRLQELLTLS